MLAQTENITRLHQLLVKGNKRQRREVAEMIQDLGLTADDLETLSEKARATADLKIRAIIFAVS